MTVSLSSCACTCVRHESVATKAIADLKAIRESVLFKIKALYRMEKDRESITPVEDRRVVCRFRVVCTPEKSLISKEFYKFGTEIAQNDTYPVGA